MAEIGVGIAEKLIEVLGYALIEEIRDLKNYQSDIEDLRKTVESAKNVLLYADSKRELPPKIRGYIEGLKAAVYDADDLFDEFFTLAELDGNKNGSKFIKKVCRFLSGKKSLASRMSRQVKDIKKQLDTIVDNRKNFDLGLDFNPTSKRKETSSYVDVNDVIGREDDKKAVIDMLLGTDDVHESFRFVTIVGVGGLGKTTLAQIVYNSEEVKAEFYYPNIRLWVSVSDQGGEQFDVKVILCRIIELVSGKRPDDTSSLELVQKQFQDQLSGKKFLLVLDDVWNEDYEIWHELRKFLTLGQEGSRVLVTTRSGEAAKIIGKNHIRVLQGLSPGDSWLLFQSVAFDKGEQEQVKNQLELIGKRIVKKCHYIPLALRVVGRLLNGCHVNDWQAFEENGLAGIGNRDNDLMPILKLSYYNLTPSLKNCFSYCSLFPKGFELQKKELINIWMAQGYIVSLDRCQSIEDAAEEHFLILLHRCFFQDVKKDEYGDIESVKMHDLMHDVALEVGREEIGVVSSNTGELGHKIRHVYFSGDALLESYLLKSKIRSFIVRYNRSIAPVVSHIGILKRLRVLCLRSAGIKRLPDSIGKLLHLRYLDLSRNYNLEALSGSIIVLLNLQTLDLTTCYELRELPKDFNKLVNLRYLDVSWCGKLTNMPCMDKLTNLRHLNLSNCYSLSSIPSSMDQLISLRHLDLSDCCKLTSMPIDMGKLTSLRHFYLDSVFSHLSSMPSGMGKLSNLRVLPLFVVGMVKRVSSDGEEQCMGELKDLKPLTNLEGGITIKIGKYYVNDDGEEGGYLKSMKHLTEVDIKFVNDGCLECEGVMEKLEPPLNLKKFNLWFYDGTKIPRWGRALDNWALSLPHLVEIKLQHCDNLQKIPSFSRLRNLKSLALDSLEKLEYMENTSSNNGNNGEESTTFFPSLESLEISCLYSLKGWWREEELVEDDDDDNRILISGFKFPRLSKLTILFCPNLTSFPSCPSLEKLDLNEVDCSGNSQGGVRLLSVEIDDVGLLKAIYSQCLTSLCIQQIEKVESLSEFGDVFRKYTSSLRSLTISYCSNLKRLGRGGLGHLTALEELIFHMNHQLSFSEDEVDEEDMPWRSLPLSLYSLNFEWLNNMKSLPKGMQYLTSLRSLSIEWCENISVLPEWISCLSSLQSLSISSCSAIKSLPESMRNLTSLRELRINGCPDELKESCKQPNGKDWLNIQHIPNIEINHKRVR